ncbi:HAD family hydrolase [Pelagicoccus albus]|uniref:HAD family phosphatase n=1 Tax=Pelagicoccus albus TaxID=415222 RepID=A0A7X1B4H9_9BACT|nr:HAD family phosphatase [Pelagicoccus albus]MBC2605519.1 HAD family phosphatase [Pelagicoccus albus]
MTYDVGFIFDWDGVVVDSSKQHAESWDIMSEREGLPLFDGHFKMGFGKRNEVIIPEILKWATEPDEVARLAFLKEETYRSIVKKSGLQPLPGVAAFLKSLIDNGQRRVVGSSTPRANIEAVTDIIGLAGCFEGVVAAEDVSRGKPDPEVFLKAADLISMKPERCVVFEDSFSGIEAGLAAGMTVVGIATTNPLASLVEAGVALAVESFEELNLERVASLIVNQ